MNKLIEAWSVNAEVQWVIFIILCILVGSSLAWNVWNFLKPQVGQGAVGPHPFVVDHVRLFHRYHPGPSGRYGHRFGVFELRPAT